jgi:hypothetical protein
MVVYAVNDQNLKLCEDNFILYAMRHYDNPQCYLMSEFADDVRRFASIKKLFYRYSADGNPRERLVLNHIIVVYNVFGDGATKMLFFQVDKIHWGTLITYLLYLNRMPEIIPEYDIVLSDIPLDEEIIKKLRKV